MNAVDDVAELDRIYLLNVDEPSEAWTEEAQSPLSPPVIQEIEWSAEAAHSAAILGYVLVAGWLLLFGLTGWGAWTLLMRP
jgi:hypothetical protein